MNADDIIHDILSNRPWLGGFKVLRTVPYSNGELMSAASPNPRSYRIGKITDRLENEGPLAVFQSLWAAEDFIKGHAIPGERDSYKIHACEYLESLDTGDPDGPVWWSWSADGTGSRYLCTGNNMPHGTDYADAVKVGRRVYSEALGDFR